MSSPTDRLHKKLARLQSGLVLTGLLCNGTVLVVKKHRKTSKEPRTLYQWTRKVNQKTVTVSLTKHQYEAFQAAVGRQRHLLERIRQMQDLSAEILLSTDDPTSKTYPKQA